MTLEETLINFMAELYNGLYKISYCNWYIHSTVLLYVRAHYSAQLLEKHC